MKLVQNFVVMKLHLLQIWYWTQLTQHIKSFQILVLVPAQCSSEMF